jgi:predicted dehydrogenase
MTLAPGHFHAALVQKHPSPELSRRAFVYAPLSDDLVDHLSRVAGFNTRPDDPTDWHLDVRAGADYLDRFRRELPGHAAVIAGRNRIKIDHVLAAVTAPCHVLVDKPWVVHSGDLPKLAEVLQQAELRDVLAWDLMTERHDIANRLLQDLVNDADVFGRLLAGTPDDPAVTLDSTHHLKKTVAGVPLRRPAWWFDPDEAGYGLADVGTHLVDLAMWLLFPEQPLDPAADVRVLDANVWPTPLSRDQFKVVTGLRQFPPALFDRIGSGDLLLYQANGTMTLALRGAHVRLTTGWDFEAPTGQSDTFEAVVRGSGSKLTVRPVPGSDGRYRSELFVTPNRTDDHAVILQAVRRRCDGWAPAYPGITADDGGTNIRIHIPDRHRTDHERHFANVLDEFLRHLRNPRYAPPWERTNVYTKYFITTTAVDLAKQKQAGR